MRLNLAARIGVWSAHHRKTAVFGWLLFVVLATGIGGASGMVDMSESENGAGDSARAAQILEDAGLTRPAGEMVMVSGQGAGDWRAAAADLRTAVHRTGAAQNLAEPVPSKDGKDALITFDMKGDAATSADRVQPVIDAVAGVRAHRPDVKIYQFGEASAGKQLSDLLSSDLRTAEFTAVPLALGILLVAFGAVVAALLPVGLALTACMAAFGLLSLASHQLHLFQTTYSVMFLMGFAVGVDYCLFYLRRERDERAAGHDAETALRIAAATSGRAVLVSGLTVMVAMAGMFLSGLMLFKGFALATIMVVFIAMLGSVTVLPALLSWLGDRIDAGRVPLLNSRGRRGARQSGAVAGKLLRPVLARPAFFAVGAVVVLLALAAPALGMKTESLGLEKQFGSSSELSVAYRHIAQSFPGGPAPANVVVKAADIGSPGVRKALATFEEASDKVTVHQRQNVAEIEVPLPGGRADLTKLREDRVPAAFEGTGATAYVTGDLAGSVDFTGQAEARHRPGLRLHHGGDLPADAVLLPLVRHCGDVGAAQPALGGRRVRGDGRRLPARLGRLADRLGEGRRDRVLVAAVRPRRPLRTVDGLPRVRGVADPGGARPGDDHTGGGGRGHPADGGRGDRRGRDHGRGVLGLRNALHAGHAADGRRPRGRGTAGRDGRADGAAARGDDAAG